MFLYINILLSVIYCELSNISDFDIMTHFVVNNCIENVVNANENNNGVRNDFHRSLSDPFILTEQIFVCPNILHIM